MSDDSARPVQTTRGGSYSTRSSERWLALAQRAYADASAGNAPDAEAAIPWLRRMARPIYGACVDYCSRGEVVERCRRQVEEVEMELEEVKERLHKAMLGVPPWNL